MLKKEKLKQKNKKSESTVRNGQTELSIFSEKWGTKELTLDPVTDEISEREINKKESGIIQGASLWSETEKPHEETREERFDRKLRELFGKRTE